ncbi:hypothetical protein BH10CYA1_BH10CYA1_01020 [soil metagenome]
MNPLRGLFLKLSKMPPAAMLLVVIGMAVVVTMMLTTTASRNEDRQSTVADPDHKLKQVVYSLTYIPAGSKISSKQVAMRETDELDVFDDAQSSLANVVGVIPQRAIPAHAQLRRVDLDPILH